MLVDIKIQQNKNYLKLKESLKENVSYADKLELIKTYITNNKIISLANQNIRRYMTQNESDYLICEQINKKQLKNLYKKKKVKESLDEDEIKVPAPNELNDDDSKVEYFKFYSKSR